MNESDVYLLIIKFQARKFACAAAQVSAAVHVDRPT
jgi:hypothetical protein